MAALTIFIATLVFLLIVFVFIALLKRPIYRVNRQNVITLLELVISGQATEDDWSVFTEMPIRYDDELEAVRQRCRAVSERHTQFSNPKLNFSESELREISEILESLKHP